MTKVIRPKSDYERRGKDIKKYPSQYDNVNYGRPRKAQTHNVVLKNTLTGQVFGYKTIEETMKFGDFISLMEDAIYDDHVAWQRACRAVASDCQFTPSSNIGTVPYEQQAVWWNEKNNPLIGHWAKGRGVVYTIDENVLSKWRIHLKNGEKVEATGVDRYEAKMKLTAAQKKVGVEKIERIAFAISESTDDTRLPTSVISEITGLIRKGAKDLQQAWKNVFELVHTAYHVANVKRPTPGQKGAWKQYEELLRVGVKALADNRGMSGEWRTSKAAFREHADTSALEQILEEASGTRSHRIFVRVKSIGFDDAEREYEVEAGSMDEVVQSFMAQAKRNGRHVRIEPVAANQMKLVVYVKGANKMRDEQIIQIKDWSM